MSSINTVRIMKFLFSGGTAAIAEYLLFLLIYALLGSGWILLAQTVSFLLGLAVSFLLNKTWVFRSKGSARKELLRYAALASINLALSNIMLWGLADVLGVNHLLAKLLVMAAVACWNYLLFSRLIFKSTV